MNNTVRLLYLYLFSFIGLILTVIGCVRLVDLGLKVYVFRGADSFDTYTRPLPVEDKANEATNAARIPQFDTEFAKKELTKERQRTVAEVLAMMLVGWPLYLYHWKQIRLDAQNNQTIKTKRK